MKKIFIFFFAFLMVSSFMVSGQTPAKKPATSGNCFAEWYNLFRERGAKPIADGSHEIIITIRTEESSQCYLGKADVENGKIKTPIYVQKQDGSYESYASLGKKLDPAWVASQNKETLYEITDGMSATFYTTDRETGKIFFYQSLNDKPKANKVAPPPSVLIKN
ncbi:MAG: hypothetical protein JNM57_07850 [Cyclobacteriaceae bacterium]|nr:hypothetical protein [Cyclobacteriaceae bacterium]